jgi:hypothetical protein
MAQRKTTKKEVAEQEVMASVAEEKEKKTFGLDEVNEMIAKAVAEALAKAQTNVVKVSAEKEFVRMLYLDDCSNDNELFFGPNRKFGSITGPVGYINVAKDDWLGEFRDNLVQSLLKSRKLIVLDGLTDEERKLHGVEYKDGEVMDEKLFRNLLDHIQELPEIYKKLCPAMKQIVATQFQTAYDENDPRVIRNREIVVQLNKISKKDFAGASENDPRREGLFVNIVRGLNKNDE